METVSLYDKDNDKVYDVMVSSEDARLANNNMIFATKLLNAAKLDENRTKQNEQISNALLLDIDNNTQSEIMPEDSDESLVHNDTQSTESCEENGQFRWSDACVLLLLRTYEEMEEKFNNGKLSHKKCWEQVAKVLKNKGYNVTGPQCASKLRSLKKTYKSIKDHNSKSGNDRRTWQHFEIMDNIFSKKAWCKPVALASSTGLSIKNIDTEESSATLLQFPYDESDAEKENNLPEKSTKTTKTSVKQLLEKRIKQKEEQETKRQKRHDDRMAMEKSLIDAVTLYLNKK